MCFLFWINQVTKTRYSPESWPCTIPSKSVPLRVARGVVWWWWWGEDVECGVDGAKGSVREGAPPAFLHPARPYPNRTRAASRHHPNHAGAHMVPTLSALEEERDRRAFRRRRVRTTESTRAAESAVGKEPLDTMLASMDGTRRVTACEGVRAGRGGGWQWKRRATFIIWKMGGVKEQTNFFFSLIPPHHAQGGEPRRLPGPRL